VKPGKKNVPITVWYEGVFGTNYPKSQTAPENSGKYAVTLDINVQDYEVTGLYAGYLEICLLTDWLANQPNNSAATAYDVYWEGYDSPHTYDLYHVKDALPISQMKFVNLDLSGSAITEIPDKAFDTYTGFSGRLKGVTTGNSITRIGQDAFCGVEITSIDISDSVTIIGDWSFYNWRVTSVNIGNGVIKIEDSTFYSCFGLAKVTIGKGVTRIEQNAFAGCINLTSVAFECTISSPNFNATSFEGDLRDAYLGNTPLGGSGGKGTYTATAPAGTSSVWTKQ
jgi:hypothetical protein